MRRKGFFVLGVLLIAVGFVFLLNSFYGMTGFVVFEDVSGRVGWIVGILFFVAGVVFLVGSRGKAEVKLYHAYASGAYRVGTPLDVSRCEHQGFYLAHSEEDAVTAVQNARPDIDPMRIQVVEVDLPQDLYEQLCVGELGDSVAQYIRVPPENFPRFNQALTENRIRMRRAPVKLRSLSRICVIT